MASILDILSWRNISTSVQKVETGIPNLLPSVFTSLTEDVLGDRTTYVTFYGQRLTARQAQYGAQSRPRALKQIGNQDVTLIHFAEHIKLRQELWLRLRQPNDLMAQTMAQEEVARHGADFRQLFDNTRVAAIALGLANGVINFDAGGNLIPTGSGATAVVSVNWGVTANNKNQLNGIIDTSWANTSADILQQIENLRIQMRKNTGRPLTYAFYGANVANYLWNNTTAQKFWQFNPELYRQFQTNPQTIPNGTFGIKYWVRMSEMFFDTITPNIDAGSTGETANIIFPANQVTFGPEIDRNNYTLYQGSIAVPRSFQIAANLDAAMANYELVYGMGGYGVPEYDPVGAKYVYFDTMLPMYKTAATSQGAGDGDLFLATIAF